ncbi:MAG TPA: DUF1800 domain-containing protein [Thermoanaerobaculia bacterium]|nr:DUF1800 domain-containing protein [Thermoanaerobaculia bacterium]
MDRIAPLLAAVSLLIAPAAALAAGPPSLSDCQKALHVLNRLGFGPRPGDVERVLSMGLPAYIEEQLHPERLADPVVDVKLAGLPTVRMTDAELVEGFEKPLRNARRVAEKEFGAVSEANMEASKAYNQTIHDLVPQVSRPERVLEELTRARILRAASSEAQLNELLVDFWMNHFNVFAGKDTDRVLLTTFEREVIRPHIWGCFRDLLLATAKSPAMLFYLDNWQSVADPDHRPGFVPPVLPPDPDAKPPAGLNENYAREILELHTLGVDGGYTQLDVVELARIFTGWGIAYPEEGGGFLFRMRQHDICAKTVLGRSFSAWRGVDEGEEAIAQLARHPSTARHIALQLCQRLVADDSPEELIQRVAARFLDTDGDLRETVRAIIESPEFFQPRFYRAKVKSPLEYIVSAIRALGGTTDGGGALHHYFAVTGEPLYLCAPPTGYSNSSAAWVNTGTMLARFNFAFALASGKLVGTDVDVKSVLPPEARSDPKRAAETLSQLLFAGDLSSDTRRRLAECVLERDTPYLAQQKDPKIALIAGTLLASPEFQKR